NPYLVDAIIGLSVVYKAFDNVDGFRLFFGAQPDTRVAVLVFGFFHGFGLATKLQDFALSPNGLVVNILSFNVGVEVGQVIALTAILAALTYWRSRPGFLRHAVLTNGVLMAVGFPAGRISIVRILPGRVMSTTETNRGRVAARERVAGRRGAARPAARPVLVVALLPAEFGVDPLGIGTRLGLTAIGDVQKKIASFEASRAASAGGAPIVAPRERPYHSETVTFALGPRQSVEYKYRLA